MADINVKLLSWFSGSNWIWASGPGYYYTYENVLVDETENHTITSQSMIIHLIQDDGAPGSSSISMLFGNNYLKVNGGIINYSTTDFTLEGWIKWNTEIQNTEVLWGDSAKWITESTGSPDDSDASVIIFIPSTNNISSLVNLDTDSMIFINAEVDNFVNGQWYSWAFCRNGPTINLFLDGQIVGTETLSSGIKNNISLDKLLCFNFDQTSDVLQRRYGQFRITIGEGRYTGSYTPTTEFFSYEKYKTKILTTIDSSLQ